MMIGSDIVTPDILGTTFAPSFASGSGLDEFK